MADKTYRVERANIMRVRRQLEDHLTNVDERIIEHLDDFLNPHNTSFIDLIDTPVEYLLQKGMIASVNDAEDGIEFRNTLSELLGESFPTGLINGGELNVIVGTDIQVIAGIGTIVDGYTNPEAVPTQQFLAWGNLQEPINAPSAIGLVHFTLADSGVPSGSVPNANSAILTQYVNVKPSPSQIRDQIYLGYVVHNSTEWGEVSSPVVVNVAAHTLDEFLNTVLGSTFIESGGRITEQDIPAFNLDQEAGVYWEMNRNWHVNRKDPHREAFPAQTPMMFRHVNRDFSTVGALVSEVEITNWDDGGVVTPIPNPAGNSAIHRIFVDPRDNYWIMYGQEVYPNFVDAVSQVGADAAASEIPEYLEGAILLGYVVAERNSSNWDLNAARYITNQEIIGSGGSTVLPQAFTDLNDTPSDYNTDALKFTRVTAGEDGIEFHTLLHDDLGSILPDQHHPQLHDHSTHTNIGTDDHHAKVHAHDGADGSGSILHSDTTGQTPNDHHNQLHQLFGTDHTDVDTGGVMEIKQGLFKNLANTLFEPDYRSKFIDPYVGGATYYPLEMVFDQGYLMSANKVTTEPAAPVDVGVPEWAMVDEPVWITPSNTSLVGSGHTYLFNEVVELNSIRVYVPVTGTGIFYRLRTLTNGNYQTQLLPDLVAGEWNIVGVDTVLVPAGTEILVYLESQNSGGNTTVTGGWLRAGNSNSNEPADQSWNTNNARTVLRIDFTDLDAVDRQIELEGIITGSEIQLAETAQSQNSYTFQVLAPPVTRLTSIEYTVALVSEGTAPPSIGEITTMTADTPVPQSTDYVGVVGGWTGTQPLWGNVESFLSFDGVDQGANIDNQYGIDVNVQRLTISADWDVMMIAGGGGGSGGSFTPDVFLGAGSSGYVPDPISESNKALFDDATWRETYSVADANLQFVHLTGDESVEGVKTWNQQARFQKEVGIGKIPANGRNIDILDSGISIDLQSSNDADLQENYRNSIGFYRGGWNFNITTQNLKTTAGTTFTELLTGQGFGINKTPAYPLDVNGDANLSINNQYLIDGVPHTHGWIVSQGDYTPIWGDAVRFDTPANFCQLPEADQPTTGSEIKQILVWNDGANANLVEIRPATGRFFVVDGIPRAVDQVINVVAGEIVRISTRVLNDSYGVAIDAAGRFRGDGTFGFVANQTGHSSRFLRDDGEWASIVSVPAGGITTGMTFDTAISTTPIAGHVRMNNADPALATILYINITNGLGNDISLFLANLKSGDFVGYLDNTGGGGSYYWRVDTLGVLNTDVYTFTVTTHSVSGSIPDATTIDLQMVGNPENRLPEGGDEFHYLEKSSSVDFATRWAVPDWTEQSTVPQDGFQYAQQWGGTYEWERTDHLQLLNIGSNTHDEIDTHIADKTNPHEVTFAQLPDKPTVYWDASGNDIFNTNSGNVGIGVSTPTELLHLKSIGSAILILEADSDNATETDIAQIQMSQDGGATAGRVGYVEAGNEWQMWTDTNNPMSLGINGASRLYINSTGIGIGNTAPSRAFHVTTATNEVARLQNTGASWSLLEFTNTTGTVTIGNRLGDFVIRPNGLDTVWIENEAPANSIRVNASGNVGINDSTPSFKLDVAGTFRVTGIGRFDEPIGVVNTFDINGDAASSQQTGLYVADLGGTQGTTLNPAFTAAIMAQTSASRSIGVTVDSTGYLYGFRSHNSVGTYTWKSLVEQADNADNATNADFAADSAKLNGKGNSQSVVANTIAERNGSSDLYARLFRSTYQNQATINGAMAFRTSTTDNYIRFCSDKAAIRAFLDVDQSGGAYSEGTWTPKLEQRTSIQKGSPVYTTQSGRWTRVGDLVTCEFVLVVNENSANTTQVWTVSMPFTFIDDYQSGVCGRLQNALFSANPDQSIHIALNGVGGYKQCQPAASLDPNNSTVINWWDYNSIKGGNLTIAGTITYRTNDA